MRDTFFLIQKAAAGTLRRPRTYLGATAITGKDGKIEGAGGWAHMLARRQLEREVTGNPSIGSLAEINTELRKEYAKILAAHRRNLRIYDDAPEGMRNYYTTTRATHGMNIGTNAKIIDDRYANDSLKRARRRV